MIKAKQVFFWTSNLKGHGFPWWQSYHFVFDLKILLIVCAVWKTFMFLKSVQYIKSYGLFNVWCWKRWIQIFSTEKIP